VKGLHEVGGLLGCNTGTVSQSRNVSTVCTVSTVEASMYVGGLVGYNALNGAVTECYSAGAVSGSIVVGGLVGRNSTQSYDPTVSNCYSTSSVTGERSVAGLVADSRGEDVIDCFWDTDTSGQPASAGGTGKNTAEMQTARTFLDAGWDFVGETENGTDDIWWISEGQDYPRLWWEGTADER
jgi:hypothetical protein